MRRIVVVLALTVAGCNAPDVPREPEPLAQGIVGGTVNSGDPAVVQMQAQKGTIGWGCTGTLIGKRLVLTAAHCVDGVDSQTKLKVMFAYRASAAKPSDYIEVVDWAADPQFMATNNIGAGHDAAVLVLGRDAPATPVPINRAPLTASMIGRAVRVIGYGFTDGYNYTGSGVKRQLKTSLKGLQQGVMTIGQAGRTTCQGDSGGPSLMTINGVESIVGITSYGFPNCTSYGSSTRVDLCTTFIDPYLKLYGGGGGCQPACSGKVCGDDGCGGTCGSCAAGQSCSAGQCLCVPACSGKVCGDDGCGGSCGSCGVGQSCTTGGSCVGSCLPSCVGKTCGDDGCGGSCGVCGVGQSCTTGGSCVNSCLPSCAGKTCGDDGCGGSCGSCGAGQTCAAGQCVCTPQCNGKVCGDDGCGGSCGVCGAGQSCSAGACVGNSTNACDKNGGWETESNNTAGQASALCKSGMIYGVLDYSGDSDWYTWQVPPGSIYTINLASMGYSMELHKLIGGQIKRLQLSMSQNKITASTSTGGTYYLRVFSPTGHSDQYMGYSVKRTISAN
jgi:V8-like Glu-specific endopeptidase